jgi:hypothetical protein
MSKPITAAKANDLFIAASPACVVKLSSDEQDPGDWTFPPPSE